MQEQPARIKIAVQKSGRLTEHSMDLLTRCGLSYSRGRDQLICYGENMPVVGREYARRSFFLEVKRKGSDNGLLKLFTATAQ